MWILVALACKADPPPELPFEQRFADAAATAKAFPAERVKDQKGWAEDLGKVLAMDKIPQTYGNVCTAVATIEQESGYQPDPSVPGIGGLIDKWIEEKQSEMKKWPGWALEHGLKAVLDTRGEGQTFTYYERLGKAKTERDVDLVFREFVTYYRSILPKPLQAAEAAAQMVGLDLDDLNPITTAGCMQVKVDYSEDHARKHSMDPELVRDALYTREGCMHYGVHRLLGWEANYDKPVYRFADYNAGFFASRNAAFQEQVALLWGKSLALDGDMMRYTDSGAVASEPSTSLKAVLEVLAKYGVELSESRVRRDLSREKEPGLEDTDTWREIRRLYQEKSGKEPDYARLPDVHLDSLKLSGDKTTAWFAQSVEKRYQSCIKRVGG